MELVGRGQEQKRGHGWWSWYSLFPPLSLAQLSQKTQPEATWGPYLPFYQYWSLVRRFQVVSGLVFREKKSVCAPHRQSV